MSAPALVEVDPAEVQKRILAGPNKPQARGLGGPAGSGSACDATYRVVLIDGGGAGSLDQPMAFNVHFSTEFLKNYPGTRVTPCVAIQKVDMTVEASYQSHKSFTQPTPGGGPATLTGVLMTEAYGSVNVVCTNMMVGDYDLDTNSSPHLSKIKFQWNPGDKEDLLPITIS